MKKKKLDKNFYLKIINKNKKNNKLLEKENNNLNNIIDNYKKKENNFKNLFIFKENFFIENKVIQTIGSIETYIPNNNENKNIENSLESNVQFINNINSNNNININNNINKII